MNDAEMPHRHCIQDLPNSDFFNVKTTLKELNVFMKYLNKIWNIPTPKNSPIANIQQNYWVSINKLKL